MQEIDYTVEFTIKEGQQDRFSALAQECIDRAKRNEKGTLEYEWYLTDDGRICHLHERFADSDAMIEHLSGDIVSEVLPQLLEVADLTGFDVHGDPSPEGQEALAAFGTRNFHELAGFVR